MKYIKAVDHLIVIVSSVMLALMMTVLALNVLLRYLPFAGGFRWYMEGSQYLNIWSAFIIGISLCLNNKHINVGAIDSILSPRGHKVTLVARAFCTCLFQLFLAYAGYLLVTRSNQNVSTMPILQMSYVYMIIPLCSILSAVSTIWGLILTLQGHTTQEETS